VFTGIVEEVGTIAAVEPAGNGTQFTIRASHVLEGMRPGDSVAIDGACLTATEVRHDGFTVDAVRTTLERTTFGTFRPGRRVNLERALAFGARLGGHLVQGHVDAVGTVRRVERVGEHVLLDVAMPEEVADVTVLHGSIAVDGVSLTVNALPAPDVFQVALIPHTWEVTNFVRLQPGDGVNLEGDMIGRYVVHYLQRSRTG
jgi:riboflavin synthase